MNKFFSLLAGLVICASVNAQTLYGEGTAVNGNTMQVSLTIEENTGAAVKGYAGLTVNGNMDTFVYCQFIVNNALGVIMFYNDDAVVDGFVQVDKCITMFEVFARGDVLYLQSDSIIIPMYVQ